MRVPGVLLTLVLLVLTVPMRAQTPSWQLSATVAESCSCTISCPCNFGGSPNRMPCEGNRMISIDSGHYGGTNLAGVQFLVTFQMGTWSKIYVTDKVTPEQEKAVEALLSCCVPTEESIGHKKPSPPIVVLHWGSTASFPAFVTSVSAKFTLFSSDGTPIRAVCSVQMEEMPGEEFRKQNPTSGSYDVRRVHRTVAGDSLASVAFAEYGDPTAWRALAAFNEIDDPLRVPTGTLLLLPTPEELPPALVGIR